ncbi:uncharacterized protein LOC140702536 isoform X1 [Pogona vitticeps]
MWERLGNWFASWIATVRRCQAEVDSNPEPEQHGEGRLLPSSSYAFTVPATLKPPRRGEAGETEIPGSSALAEGGRGPSASGSQERRCQRMLHKENRGLDRGSQRLQEVDAERGRGRDSRILPLPGTEAPRTPSALAEGGRGSSAADAGRASLKVDSGSQERRCQCMLHEENRGLDLETLGAVRLKEDFGFCCTGQTLSAVRGCSLSVNTGAAAAEAEGETSREADPGAKEDQSPEARFRRPEIEGQLRCALLPASPEEGREAAEEGPTDQERGREEVQPISLHLHLKVMVGGWSKTQRQRASSLQQSPPAVHHLCLKPKEDFNKSCSRLCSSPNRCYY